MNLSVIVCCYNSSTRIIPTLEYLAKQEFSNLSCELVVVDNNCSDNSIDVIQSTWLNLGFPFPLHIVSETVPGLSNARKTGVMAAKGEIITFCDDDNWLKYNYVEKVYSIFKENLNIGVLGGRSIPVSDIEFPVWFTTFQTHYAVGVQSLSTGIVNNREYLWGAGMSFRRLDMLKLYKCGFSNILTGRSSDGKIISGDDTEICKWFRLIGKDLYYHENLVFSHFIDKKRLSREYLKSLLKSFDNYREIIFQYHLAIKIVQLSNLKFRFKNLRIIFFLLRKQKFAELKVYTQFLSYRYFVFNRFHSKIFNNLNYYSKL